jgi:uncharacterized repeat protein (TIGR01451 family)
MKLKWLIPTALAVSALALVILFSQGVGQAQMPLEDLMVTKAVSPSVVAPGENVIYTVTMSNTTGVALAVTSVVDTLPDGFEYIGLAWDSDWGEEPVDADPPEIRWSGPITVPMSGALTLRYWIHVPLDVPLSPEPYMNTVVVSDTYTAEAGLLVAVGDVSLDKTAAPLNLKPEEYVTYTVRFSNSGYVPVPLAVVTDVLPAGVTFMGMTPDSDVADPPSGVAGTIEWAGPFSVGSHDDLTVEYLTRMPVRVAPTEPMTAILPHVRRNWAPPVFVVSKSAFPELADATDPGQLINYTVVFVNEGTAPGVLNSISDVLPAGFTFVTMLPDSDVTQPPVGVTGSIVWTGPFTVQGGSSLRLIYQARAASVPGTYTNSVTATVANGRLVGAPAVSTVVLEEPFFLIEDFESPSPYWEPFLNYWRLNDLQWHYKPGGSYDGSTALGHTFWFGVDDPEDGAHDALFMYKDPAAEQWTDYSFRTRAVLYFDDGSNRGQFGLWFRGIHRDSELSGRWVTGYYFTLKPAPPIRAYLMTLRTDEECGDDCNYNYHFSNPLVLESRDREELEAAGVYLETGRWYWLRVDVEGPHIRCYVDDHLVFDYYDDVGSIFTEGTVGFATYIAGDARFDNVTVEPLE